MQTSDPVVLSDHVGHNAVPHSWNAYDSCTAVCQTATHTPEQRSHWPGGL